MALVFVTEDIQTVNKVNAISIDVGKITKDAEVVPKISV